MKILVLALFALCNFALAGDSQDSQKDDSNQASIVCGFGGGVAGAVLNLNQQLAPVRAKHVSSVTIQPAADARNVLRGPDGRLARTHYACVTVY